MNIIFLFLFTTVNSVEHFNQLGDLKITIPFFVQEPKINGFISENEWKKAVKLSNFTEFQPKENKKPSVKTEVYVGYTENALYVAFKCYDDVSKIWATLADRDNEMVIFTDDIVGIFLDTYGDFRNTYMFFTNPFGVQVDAIKMENGEENYEFDTGWNVSAKVFDDFWVAEFKIPFSSIRFPRKDKYIWRINFTRERPRENREIYYWVPVSKNNPSFMAQSGYAIIEGEIKGGEKNLSILPYFIGSQTGWRDAQKYALDRGKFNTGLSAKYRILSNLVLDLAVNPDYAQIETDAFKIDVNTPYALYYSEKRPFFMEGANYVETPLDIIYTRTINVPIFAEKIAGKIGPYSVYYLLAFDKKTLWIIPNEDYSFSLASEKKSYSNILRIKRDILKDSYIGFLLAHREMFKERGASRLGGIDAWIRFFNHYIFEYSGFYSYTQEIADTSLSKEFDGEKFHGGAQYSAFTSVFRNLFLKLGYKELSPYFRSDLGYISSNNHREFSLFLSPRFYPNKYGITQFRLNYSYTQRLNWKWEKKKEGNSLGFNIVLPRKIRVWLWYDNYFQRWGGKEFKGNYEYGLSLQGFPLDWLNFNIIAYREKTINYNTLEPSYANGFYLGFSLKTFKHLNIKLSANSYYLYRERWKNIIYDVTTLTSWIQFQWTKNLSMRIILQHYTYNKKLAVAPLLSYELDPFTVFYFGVNINTIKQDEPFGIQGTDHQIFAKFQYWFKI